MAEVAKSTPRAVVEKCMVLYRSATNVLLHEHARLGRAERVFIPGKTEFELLS